MSIGQKYAIILPAGCGKSTLAKKYIRLYDIDSFLSYSQRKELQELWYETKETDNWTHYEQTEYQMIYKQIEDLPSGSVVLLHSKSKAKLYNLIVIGFYKTSKRVIEEVAKQRLLHSHFSYECTLHNWETSIDATILETHRDIETQICLLLQKYW